MVIEVVTLIVKPDEEAAFVKGFTEGVKLIQAGEGCHSVRWGKRVEPELAYMVEIQWETIEHHFEYRKTEDFKTFGGSFRPHLVEPPSVFHFEPR